MHTIMLSRATLDQTLMIGDRPERGGEGGRRAGVRSHIRTRKRFDRWGCFSTFRQIAIH